MLIQFAVENYMSLRDETVLSMNAGAGSELRENLQDYQDGYLLPTAAIYGANAAGKSNIFKAMTAALRIIRESNDRQIDRLCRSFIRMPLMRNIDICRQNSILLL